MTAVQVKRRSFERGFERFMGFFEVHRTLGPLRYFSWAVAIDQLGGRTIPTFSPQAEAADLTGLALELALWGAAPDDLAFLTPPPEGAYAEARALLRMLGALERYDEALEMQERAHELDPLEHRLDRLSTLLRAGRYDEALPPARELVEKEPGFGLAHTTLGWTYILMGRHEEGVTALRHALSLYPENDMYRAQLGQALGMTGDIAGAKRTLRELLVDTIRAQQVVSAQIEGRIRRPNQP